MRTKHHVVIGLPKSEKDEETKDAAKLLHAKYAERTPKLITNALFIIDTKAVVGVSSAKKQPGKGVGGYLSGSGQPNVESLDDPIGDLCKGSDDVGVHLVFHCDSSGYPTVFDACHSHQLAYKMDQEQVARGLVKIAHNKNRQ